MRQRQLSKVIKIIKKVLVCSIFLILLIIISGCGNKKFQYHHILPRKYEKWFEKLGFKGKDSIHNYCIKVEKSEHLELHGGAYNKFPEWDKFIKSFEKREKVPTKKEVINFALRLLKKKRISNRIAL